MNNLTLIEQLKHLGLSENEAKCYKALLERESLMVSDISKLTGIARPNTYEAMKRLVIKGLSATIPGDVKKYSASPPSSISEQLLNEANRSLDTELENLERKKQEILLRKQSLNDSANRVIGQLNSIYDEREDNSNPLEYIEVFKNSSNIHRKFVELFNRAEKEVLAFTKPPITFNSEEQIKEQVEAQLAAFHRNVILRNVVQMPTDKLIKAYSQNRLIFPDKAIKGRKRDQHSKFVDELPAKLFVFDERVCFFAFEDPIKTKTSVTMLVAEHEAMAKSFKLLFETVWEKANDHFILGNKKYYLYEPEGEEEQGENK